MQREEEATEEYSRPQLRFDRPSLATVKLVTLEQLN